MRKTIALPLALSVGLGLSACNDPAVRDQVGTGVASAGIAAVAATALGANEAWTIIAAGAAATAGALYARNRQTNQCAYHTGQNDEVVVRPCG